MAWGAVGEMTQQLRVSVALADDPSLFLNPTWWLTTSITQFSGDLMPDLQGYQLCT